MASSPVEIGGGFSEGELKFASFWVRNHLVLTRALYGFLFTIGAILWLYILWGLADAFLISYPRESRLTTEIALNQVMISALAADQPKNISPSVVTVLAETDGRLDMAVDLENTNDQWWVDFTYHFNVSGEQTPARHGFVMPLTKTAVTELGFRPKNRGGATAQLVVDDIHWHRVDPSVVGSKYPDYQNDHFNVVFENITFNQDLVIGSQTVGRTSFDIKNRGSYGYWGMDLIVRLYRGASVIAINKINVTHLVPGETRHIDIDWFERIPAVTKTEILPVINFLDKSTYLPTEEFAR
ncbi:MAG: hypothetical protein ABIO72_05240 [Patescibacteria group bacterium]